MTKYEGLKRRGHDEDDVDENELDMNDLRCMEDVEKTVHLELSNAS